VKLITSTLVLRSSNSLRVIKTTKQTAAEAITYPQVTVLRHEGSRANPALSLGGGRDCSFIYRLAYGA